MSKKKEALDVSVNEILLSMVKADFKKNIREDYSGIEELAESIRKHGQLEPVGIDANDNLIYGFRRFKAVKEILKWDSIKFVKIELDKKDRETIQLVENIHRTDLTDYEIAETLNSLKKKEKLSDKELAGKIGKSEKWVNEKISHYMIAENTPEAKILPSSIVNETRSLKTEEQKKLLKKAKEEKLSVKKTRELAKKEKDEKIRRRISEKPVNEPEENSRQREKKTPKLTKDRIIELNQIRSGYRFHEDGKLSSVYVITLDATAKSGYCLEYEYEFNEKTSFSRTRKIGQILEMNDEGFTYLIDSLAFSQTVTVKFSKLHRKYSKFDL